MSALVDESAFWTPAYAPESAWTEHAPFAFWLIGRLRPSTLVEIGVHHGYSFCAFCEAVVRHKTQTLCFGVDTWLGDEHAGFYDDDVFRAVAAHNERFYSSFSTLIRSTFDEAVSNFEDGSIDLLHIDGRHFYEDVRHDFETWLPKMSSTGVVLLHDTNVHERDFGITRYFAELSLTYPTFAFMHGHGLGVVYVGTAERSPIADLMERGADVAGLYATLGAGLAGRIRAADRDSLREELTRVEAARQDLADTARLSEAELDELRKRLSDTQQELSDTQQELSDTQQELSELRSDLMAQNALVETLMKSTSWRVTGPARAVMRGRRGVSPRRTALRLARASYRALPVSPQRKARLRDFLVHRFLGVSAPAQSVGMPPGRESHAHRPAHAAPFPLPGYLTVHPQIAGNNGKLDVSVSVVIPTYNAGSEFYWLLRKLKAQKCLDAVEIVIVDSGSTDNTVAFAEDAGCTVVTISNSEFSHSYARNLGAKNAHGDLLVFMVQDAYPIGDNWLYGLAKTLLGQHGGVQLSAISCSEFPRTDSELFYDAIVDIHYHFLGSANGDRVGRLTGDDNESLRSQGQLSDVACMMPRALFTNYWYEGRYAEDLKFGIRLIREGHRIGMLSSIKVVHSHHRSQDYYLRRSFTDVAYLRDTFPDFPILPVRTLTGALIGAQLAADGFTKRLEGLIDNAASPAEALNAVASSLRRTRVPRTLDDRDPPDFGLASFRAWSERVMTMRRNSMDRLGRAEQSDVEALLAGLASRLDSIRPFVERTFPAGDATVSLQINDAVWKCLAASVGTQYGYALMTYRESGTDIDVRSAEEIEEILLAGI